MKDFEITIMVTNESDDALVFDSSVVVNLPAGTTVTDDQLATLTKKIASLVGHYIRDQYAGADTTVCT